MTSFEHTSGISNFNVDYRGHAPPFNRPLTNIANIERNIVAKRNRRIAEDKAEDLLRMVLSDEQKMELVEHDHFHVHTEDGTRKYRIKRGKQHNILLLGADDKVVEELCVHLGESKGRIPVADHMAAQKLMVEANESHMRFMANIWRREGQTNYGLISRSRVTA